MLEQLAGIIPSLFITMLGLCLGSFLNVCICRIPDGKSLLRRSRCRHCKQTILWRHNLPLVSYAWLRGRCAHCREEISFHYPIVELFAALASLVLFFSATTVIAYIMNLLLFLYLLLVAVIDLRTLRIPSSLIATGLVFWLCLLVTNEAQLTTSLLGALAGGGVMFIIKMLGDFLYAKPTLGLGDVKLAFILGLLLGPVNMLIGIVVACFLGGIIGLSGILFGFLERHSKLAFGPFLAVAAWTSWLWPNQLISLLEKVYGI